MTTKRFLTNQRKTNSEQAFTNPQRRTFIGGALAALLASPGRAVAQETIGRLNDPFILLLKGLYQPVPVGGGPPNNLGLTVVNLSDGSYSKTSIYPVFGIPGTIDQSRGNRHFLRSVRGEFVCLRPPRRRDCDEL
jgi:hypothetical protein